MILDILNRLAATSKRSEKESILSSIKGYDRELFINVAFAALSLEHDFYVKTYDRGRPNENPTMSLAEAIFIVINELASRKTTGTAACNLLTRLSESLSLDDSEVLYRIIQRDLKCGVSHSTINKVFPGTIYVPPYMRCSSLSQKTLSNIRFPCYSQTKEDGQYVDIIVTDNTVKYRSRNATTYHNFNSPEVDSLLVSECEEQVLMGEVLVIDEFGKYLSRKEGNGYLNSDDVDPKRLVYVVWDTVSYSEYTNRVSNTKYMHRYQILKDMVNRLNSKHIKLVETKICNSVDDIVEAFKDAVSIGKEGTVIKDFAGKWKDHTSPYQVKCKIEFEVELEITGINEGTNSNEGKLGAFTCQSSDGKVIVNVGTGFKDSERVKYFDEKLIGKIVTVRANDIVQDKTDLSVYSLFLPRFIEIRSDKTEADDLKRIIEQKESFVDILSAIK